MSAGYLLRLMRDRLEPGGRLSLPPVNRVLYVVEGQLSIEGATLTANEARHRTGAVLAASAGGATALRYELVRAGAPAPGGTLLLEHAIALDPAAAYLMRCDRVDFDLARLTYHLGTRSGQFVEPPPAKFERRMHRGNLRNLARKCGNRIRNLGRRRGYRCPGKHITIDVAGGR